MWILILIPFVVLADQLTKFFAVRGLSDIPTIPVIPHVFHFTLVKNTGVAFGLLRHASSHIILLTTVSAAVLFVILFRAKRSYDRLALGLILGGALGNLVDRIRLGFVIDFLDFRIWPVFNIADTCVSIGVGLLLLDLLRKPAK